MPKIIYLDIDSRETAGIKELEITAYNTFGGADIRHMQILESAAGFYIGDLSLADWSPGPEQFWEPYSRDSACYWATREEAEHALKTGKYPVKF